jgi:hypothetical protein
MPLLTLPILMLALAASESPHTAVTTDTPATTANMRVYVDPETGTLSPTPVTQEQREHAQREVRSASAQSNQFPSKRMPDGSLMVEFGENMMMDTTATVDADGKTHINCAQTHVHDEVDHDKQIAPDARNDGEYK